MADDQSAPRIKVFNLNGDAMWDFSADDIPAGMGPSLTVEDLLGQSASYSRIYKSGSTQMLVHENLLEWGSSYQIVCMPCPACTLCESSCTRQAEQHELCAHVSGSCMHIWHDLRKRSNSARCGMAKYITIQGYVDGLGLDSELEEGEIFREAKQIAIEIVGDASSFTEKQHRLNLLCEWEHRAANFRTVVRSAIAAGRECCP